MIGNEAPSDRVEEEGEPSGLVDTGSTCTRVQGGHAGEVVGSNGRNRLPSM